MKWNEMNVLHAITSQALSSISLNLDHPSEFCEPYTPIVFLVQAIQNPLESIIVVNINTKVAFVI